MGYVTRYSLKTDADEKTGRKIEQWAALHLRDCWCDYALECEEEGRTYTCRDSVKWYDHEIDMRKLSAQFPDVLFTLSGEGENSDDIWRKYFNGGKCQVDKAVLVFTGFKPEWLV